MKSIKKGFTIVELVIVIAIVAILSGIGVGTYFIIINRAKESNDEHIVAGCNSALATELDKKPKTMFDALKIVEDNGLKISSIKAKAENIEILWDSVNNAFCYFNNDDEKYTYLPEDTFKNENVKEYDYWSLIDAEDDKPKAKFDKKWSIYLKSSKSNNIEIDCGVDIGECENVTSVTYKGFGTASQEPSVIIRTNNHVSTFTVNAPNDSVNHYGEVGSVVIEDVANNSYHEFGKVMNDFTIKSGRVVIETSANIDKQKIIFDVASGKKARLDYVKSPKNYEFVNANGDKITNVNKESSNIEAYIIDKNKETRFDPTGCLHKYDIVGKINPTCTKDGYTHYKCSLCGDEYDGDIVKAIGHDMSHINAVAATCDKDGRLEHWECSHESGVYYANEQGTETLNSIVVSKLGHNMTRHEAKAATCTEDGNVEYWTCSHESGVYFGNAEGTKKLDSIVVPKHGHDMTHHAAKAATCTEDGTVEYWTCSHESGVYFGNAEGTKKLDTIVDFKHGHDMTHHAAKAATCTENGYVEYWTCSHESGVYYKNEQGTETLSSIDISKLAHKNNKHFDKVEPSEGKHGSKEYWYCPDCGKYYSDSLCTNEIKEDINIWKTIHSYGVEASYNNGEIELTNLPKYVVEGEKFAVNVSPKSYKYKVSSVEVKMGSTILENAYNSSTGDIIVNNVTGDISITVTEASNNIFTMYQAGMKFSSSGTIDKSGNNIGTTTSIKAGYTGNNIAGPFKISVGDVFHLENMKMGMFAGCPDIGAMSIGISSSNEEYYLGAKKGYIQCSTNTNGFGTQSGPIPGLEFSYKYGDDKCLTSITVLKLPNNIDLYIYLGYFSSSSGNPAIYLTHNS